PVAGLIAMIVKEVAQGYTWASQTIRSEGMNGLISHLPDQLEKAVRWLMDRLDVEVGALSGDLGSTASAQGGRAATAVTGFLSATGQLAFQGTMMLIALYFLLVDGEKLVEWLDSVVPRKAGQAI